MASERGMPFVRLELSLAHHYISDQQWWHDSDVYTGGTVPEAEIKARKAITTALVNNCEGTVETLTKLTTEFRYDVRQSTGVVDRSNILCTALVYFFTEYQAEFQINISTEGRSTRTLKRALNELASFLPGDQYESRLEVSGGRSSHVLAISKNVLTILEAVRKFLLEKASVFSVDTVFAARKLAPRKPVSEPVTRQITSSEEGPKSEKDSRLGIDLTLETKKRRAKLTTGIEAPLKRKRSDVKLDLSGLEGFVQDALDIEALGQEQKQEIIQLKATVQMNEKLAEELTATRFKAGMLKKRLKTHQCAQEELAKAKLEVEKAQKDAATAVEEFSKIKREGDIRMSQWNTWQAKRINIELKWADQESMITHLRERVLKTESERDAAKKELKKTLDLKNALKDILLVTRLDFEAEVLETAATAITDGRSPRSVVADMIRDGAV